MLDLKWIRENPDKVREGLAAKKASFDLDHLLKLDLERRALLAEVEQLKSQRNAANETISRHKKEGNSKGAEAIIADLKSLSQKINEIDGKVGLNNEILDNLILTIPNIPHKTVPIAKGSIGNQIVRSWGEPKLFKDCKPLDHLKLSESSPETGSLRMEIGSKITGSGFPVYFGLWAKLQRALINFMLDLHATKHGYTEVWPPALVNRKSMTGTGQLPKLEEDMYRLKDDNLFLIPTAEVPVTNILRDEILEEKNLPQKFTAYSPCFRREAGSYGKDTRGLSRVHQFDKVELVKFVKPEDSQAELELLVRDAEEVLQALELHYRVILLGSGDLSFAAEKCYDLEIWAPGTGKWFEVSSCSSFGDFQARRMNIRFRRQANKKLEYVHTLNGSGVALARLVLCLLENIQTPQGVRGAGQFPKALRPYLESGLK